MRYTLFPIGNDYVGNDFTIHAEIKYNPRPITTMKAYIDNTVFAVSNGPIMSFPVTDAPNGTHILTVPHRQHHGYEY